MLFLVTGDISRTPYMGNTSYRKVTRIVEAENSEQAEEKFNKHFEDKSSDYAISYYSTVYECIPVIT